MSRRVWQGLCHLFCGDDGDGGDGGLADGFDISLRLLMMMRQSLMVI